MTGTHRTALAALALCAALAAGCAGVPERPEASRSRAYFWHTVSAQTATDASVTADAVTGVPAALQRNVEQSGKGLASTRELYFGDSEE